ncbi:MAG: hypothetical protein ABWY27_16105 [Telluria sp.]
MEETRIDRLEQRLDGLVSEMRAGFRAVDTRLCRVESRLGQTDVKLGAIGKRLDQTATKADLLALEFRFESRLGQTQTDLHAVESRLESRLDQTATKEDLHELRTEVYRLNGEMKTWMIATTITLMTTFLVALFGLHHWNG